MTGSAVPPAQSPRRWRSRVPDLSRNGVLVLFAIVSIIPMLWLLLAPSKTGAQLQNQSPFAFGSFDNYVLAWNNLQSLGSGIIVRWIGNSIAYTSAIVLLAVSSATLAGFVLAATRFPFKQAWLIITLIAMLIPPVALVLPLFIEIKTIGLFDSPLAVIFTTSFFPFGTFLAYIYFATAIPKELYEAAKIDGCGEYRTFWSVAMPLAKPLIGVLAFFAFAASWADYFLPYVLLASNDKFTLPLGLGVLFSSTPALNPGLGASQLPIGRPEVALAGLLVAIPVLVVFLLSQRFLVRGMLAGGVKS